MQPINKESFELFPKEFHNRLIKDNTGKYWISYQRRSELGKSNDTYYPMDAYIILQKIFNK